MAKRRAGVLADVPVEPRDLSHLSQHASIDCAKVSVTPPSSTVARKTAPALRQVTSIKCGKNGNGFGWCRDLYPKKWLVTQFLNRLQ
jgi:hypothetical protein